MTEEEAAQFVADAAAKAKADAEALMANFQDVPFPKIIYGKAKFG